MGWRWGADEDRGRNARRSFPIRPAHRFLPEPRPEFEVSKADRRPAIWMAGREFCSGTFVSNSAFPMTSWKYLWKIDLCSPGAPCEYWVTEQTALNCSLCPAVFAASGSGRLLRGSWRKQ